MSGWVYFFGIMTSLNAAFGFMSRSDAARNIAILVGISFFASMLIETAQLPVWLLSLLGADLSVYGVPVPWQMVCLAILDAYLLFKFRAACRHTEMAWAVIPLTAIQLVEIFLHAATVATRNQFDHLYYQALDVLFSLTLLISAGGSVSRGIDLHLLFGSMRGHPDPVPARSYK